MGWIRGSVRLLPAFDKTLQLSQHVLEPLVMLDTLSHPFGKPLDTRLLGKPTVNEQQGAPISLVPNTPSQALVEGPKRLGLVPAKDSPAGVSSKEYCYVQTT
eukprot:m.188972 g.188972  ORF g.188972 m.188972 type:complete len:102 (+) comp18197_c0_seq8:922-1227(+)